MVRASAAVVYHRTAEMPPSALAAAEVHKFQVVHVPPACLCLTSRLSSRLPGVTARWALLCASLGQLLTAVCRVGQWLDGVHPFTALILGRAHGQPAWLCSLFPLASRGSAGACCRQDGARWLHGFGARAILLTLELLRRGCVGNALGWVWPLTKVGWS
jgi:hypothetical protein